MRLNIILTNNHIQLRPNIDRSQGVHLTAIMKLMQQQGSEDNWEDYKNLTGDEKRYVDLQFEVGFLWEDVVKEQLVKRYKYQSLFQNIEPFEKDGIWVSPDGISMRDNTIIVEEMKTTKKKKVDNLDDSKFWWWHTQLKAYCHCIGTNYGRWHVLWLNGDYQWRKAGKLSLPANMDDSVFEVEFSDSELQDNWRNIVNFYNNNKDLF